VLNKEVMALYKLDVIIVGIIFNKEIYLVLGYQWLLLNNLDPF